MNCIFIAEIPRMPPRDVASGPQPCGGNVYWYNVEKRPHKYPSQADNFDEVTIVGKSGISLLSLIQGLSEDHYSVREPPG